MVMANRLQRWLRRNRATCIWTLLLSTMTTALCFVPLFDRLAYPLCLVLGLLASFAGVQLAASTVGRLRVSDWGLTASLLNPVRLTAVLALRCTAPALSALIPPLLIALLNALRVRNCDLIGGLAYFALLPMLSAVLASWLGLGCALLLGPPKRAVVGGWLLVLSSLAWTLARLYLDPPLFAYDPFGGYWPGAFYDDNVEITPTLLIYRLHNLLWALGGLLLAACVLSPSRLRLGLCAISIRRASAPAAVLSLVCLLAAACLFVRRSSVGFAIDSTALQTRLAGRLHTQHFDIYHVKGLSAETRAQIAEDHEFRYAQLRTRLGGGPIRIRSYLFESERQKKRLIGAGSTLIARPWDRAIYLNRRPFPHTVLMHELAHVFAADFGDPLLGVSLRWRRILGLLPYPTPNLGLIEGFAVAIETRLGAATTLAQAAATLKTLDALPRARDLFGLGFLTQGSRKAYAIAGAFCDYLIRSYGIDSFKVLYRSGGNFNKAYGRPLDQLFADWRRSLDQVPLADWMLQHGRERFRRRSIFRRVCPHAIAKLRRRVADLRRNGRTEDALAVVLKICSLDPGEPRHLLTLMQSSRQNGMQRLFERTAQRLLQHPKLTTPLHNQVVERLGDQHWRLGKLGQAKLSYQRARALRGASARVLHLKQWALEQPSRLRHWLKTYLLASTRGSRDAARDIYATYRIRALAPTTTLGDYLLGKQLSARGHCDLALRPLRHSLDGRLPNVAFRREALRSFAQCAYKTGQLLKARAAFSQLAADSGLSPAGLLETNDWLARIAWRL